MGPRRLPSAIGICIGICSLSQVPARRGIHSTAEEDHEIAINLGIQGTTLFRSVTSHMSFRSVILSPEQGNHENDATNKVMEVLDAVHDWVIHIPQKLQ